METTDQQRNSSRLKRKELCRSLAIIVVNCFGFAAVMAVFFYFWRHFSPIWPLGILWLIYFLYNCCVACLNCFGNQSTQPSQTFRPHNSSLHDYHEYPRHQQHQQQQHIQQQQELNLRPTQQNEINNHYENFNRRTQQWPNSYTRYQNETPRRTAPTVSHIEMGLFRPSSFFSACPAETQNAWNEGIYQEHRVVSEQRRWAEPTEQGRMQNQRRNQTSRAESRPTQVRLVMPI